MTTAVKHNLITPSEIVGPKKIQIILATKNNLQPQRLKELKEALPENITYQEILCVLAEKD